jgi:hypothetical protein
MENKDRVIPTAKTCAGSGFKGHAQAEYDNIGISPCGEYVAHKSDLKCDVIGTVVEASLEPHECQCRTDFCPCGEFLSHKISEPCTAKE